MPSSPLHVFVVEGYLPLPQPSDTTDIALRLERAQDALRSGGREIRWLHALVLPRDEAWLCVFAADDVGDVLELNQLANVVSDAVLEAQLVLPRSAC